MQRKIGTVIAVLCVMTGLLTGCGNQKSENITEGMRLVEALSYEEALPYFEKALEEKENKELAYRGQALAHMGLTMYEEAVDDFMNAFSNCEWKLGALEYDMNYYLATAYIKLGKHTEAEQTYTAILAMKPKEVDAWFLRGFVRLQENDKTNAIADFEQAISLQQDDVDLTVDVYQALSDAGYEEDGKIYLQNMIDRKGEQISDYELGVLSFYMEDYETARIHLDSSLNKKDAKASLVLGKTYEALGDLNYAAVVYSTYLENADPDVEILNRLGVCKMKQKSYQEALDAFQAAIAVENNSMMQTLKYNEIVAYEYLQEFDQAHTLIQSYLATYPDDAAAVREAVFLETR